MRTASDPIPDTRPEAPLAAAFDWPTGDGHVLHVRRPGTPAGLPALVLHGGPGSGAGPVLWRAFDLRRWHLVVPDQRGAGASTPRGGLVGNTTAHLLADLRRLRRALGIDRWWVVGGSWGATLAIAHALDEPEAVAGLLLRNTFVPRPADIDAFFDDGHGRPAVPWRAFGALDADAQGRVALAWWQHERQRTGAAEPAPVPAGEALATLVDRYRVQAHYLAHGCWLGDLLERVPRLPPVPAVLLHGTDDRVCPITSARELHAAWPAAARARFVAVTGAGHDPTHPAMVQAMTQALAAFDRRAAGGDVR